MTSQSAVQVSDAAPLVVPTVPINVQPKAKANHQTLILLALATVYIVWSTTYLGIRFALESFPPYMLMGVRFLIAGAIFFIVARLRHMPAPTLRQWRNSAIYGGLLMVMGMGGVALAEGAVSSGLAATMVAISPVWAMLFGLLWGSRPRRVEWIGVICGIIGVALLSLEGNLKANPAGILLLLLSSLCWSLGSVWSKHLDLPKGMMGTASEFLAGGFLLMVVSTARGEHLTSAPTVGSVAALIYLIVFGSWAAFSAYNYLLKEVRPALATSYALVNPALALILGVILGGEQITGSAVIALPIILLGLGLVVFQKKSQTAEDNQ
jgi:drug/metabolite transporter (DMT)-like permease